MPSEKNDFRQGAVGVCTYLLFATRDTVLMSMPMRSAMSFKIMGFNHLIATQK